MSKKIEPTEAMVKEALSQRPITLTDTIRTILRVALNHPDARGLFADEDALRAAREQGTHLVADGPPRDLRTQFDDPARHLETENLRRPRRRWIQALFLE